MEIPRSEDVCNEFLRTLLFIVNDTRHYLIGDLLLIDRDGASSPWLFAGSSYIAEIDAHFDYKHERKEDLERIIEIREWRIFY